MNEWAEGLSQPSQNHDSFPNFQTRANSQTQNTHALKKMLDLY